MTEEERAFHTERLKDAYNVLAATLPHAGERFAETLRFISADICDAARYGDYAAAQAAESWLVIVKESIYIKKDGSNETL